MLSRNPFGRSIFRSSIMLHFANKHENNTSSLELSQQIHADIASAEGAGKASTFLEPCKNAKSTRNVILASPYMVANVAVSQSNIKDCWRSRWIRIYYDLPRESAVVFPALFMAIHLSTPKWICMSRTFMYDIWCSRPGSNETKHVECLQYLHCSWACQCAICIPEFSIEPFGIKLVDWSGSN